MRAEDLLEQHDAGELVWQRHRAQRQSQVALVEIDPPRPPDHEAEIARLKPSLVEDLDQYLAELAERGLRTGPIDEAPGRFRRAVFTDPAGNTITYAEVLSS